MSSLSHKNERVALLAITLVFLLLTSMPYLAGYVAQNQSWVFSGAVLDRQDYAVHLATMHLGAQGNWQYHLQFSSEAHPGAYVKLAYIFLGHLATWLGVSLPAAYQLGRLVGGLAACLAIYWLVCEIFPGGLARWMALGLALFASGLGWLQTLFHWMPVQGISPDDFWLIDAYVFMGGLAFPHFLMVFALLASMAASFLRARRLEALRWWLLVGVFSVASQLIQPFASLLLDLVMACLVGIDMLIRQRLLPRQIAGLGLVAIGQLPLFLYNLSIFNSDPVWAGFAAQNVTLSPPPIYYLFGFGVLWCLVLPGLWATIRPSSVPNDSARKLDGFNRDGLYLAGLWCAGALLLAYAPTNLQRRFMQAYTIPLGILGSAGFIWLLDLPPRWSWQGWLSRRRNGLAFGFVLFSAISSLCLSWGYSLLMIGYPPTLFDPVDRIQAVDWLSQNGRVGEVVLASEATSQLVAARAGLPVYFGHPIETIQYEQKKSRVEAILAGEIDASFLSKNNIHWIVFKSTKTGGNDRLMDLPFLELAYQNPTVQIFKVTP